MQRLLLVHALRGPLRPEFNGRRDRPNDSAPAKAQCSGSSVTLHGAYEHVILSDRPVRRALTLPTVGVPGHDEWRPEPALATALARAFVIRDDCTRAPRQTGVIPVIATPDATPDAPASERVCRAADPRTWPVRPRISSVGLDDCGWHLIDQGGRLRAERAPPRFHHVPAPAIAEGSAVGLTVGDADVVGFDAGWGGGGLWWSKRGSSRWMKIASAHVRALATVNGETVAVTGTGTDLRWAPAGALLHLVQGPDGLVVGGSVGLGGEPELVASGPDGSLWIVVGNHDVSRVLRVRDALRVEVVHQTRGWPGLPTSLALDASGAIHVTEPGVVVQLVPTPDGMRERWLAPPECAREDAPQQPCTELRRPAVGDVVFRVCRKRWMMCEVRERRLAMATARAQGGGRRVRNRRPSDGMRMRGATGQSLSAPSCPRACSGSRDSSVSERVCSWCSRFGAARQSCGSSESAARSAR